MGETLDKLMARLPFPAGFAAGFVAALIATLVQ